MDRFITACCDHDLTALVIYGHGKPRDLQRAWDYIYSEYIDQSGNQTSKELIKLSKDISWHDAKLKACSIALKILQSGPNKDAIWVLRDHYGYNYPFDWSKPEEYAKSLDIIATRLGHVVFLLQQKTAEYDRETKKIEGKPMTRESFGSMLATLSVHMHAPIHAKEISVAEFIQYKRNYEREMEAIQKQTAKSISVTHNHRNI